MAASTMQTIHVTSTTGRKRKPTNTKQSKIETPV
jgi:hypothetical protein